ncbi:MAG: hypothetical protein MUF01_01355 [Bryobacterales bacterium]|jgi:flagellar basal-body rod modification protein FlgD|nr:hypothetical protein [Bryobacterales bacterium]
MMNPIGFLTQAMQGGGSRIPDTAREMRSANAANNGRGLVAGANDAATEGARGGNDAATGSSASPAIASGLATKETFLTLLVAQIKNQNPLNPADGTEFLSQLAQFTQVEQLISIRQELETMGQQNQALTQAAARNLQSS